MNYSIVVPTIGRESLYALLDSLAAGSGPMPQRIIVVDDARDASVDAARFPASLAASIVLLRSGAHGPAAARNRGWRETSTRWVVFVDDDVLLTPSWRESLVRDLETAAAPVGGIQGKITVPLPEARRATDWERNVRGLMDSVWITADMAYRRDALEVTGGFDERFKRAYREDADLAIRVKAAGFELVMGERHALHPVRRADRWISVRLQRGNADDVLMRALHGKAWRERAGSPRGRFVMHAATVSAAAVALTAALDRRSGIAAAAAAAWLLMTAEFTWRRVAPGPRTPGEVATMAATSAAIPFAAVYHKLRGAVMLPSLLRGDAA